MKVCLFSQSLFAFDLPTAVRATVDAGYPAIELACSSPHLDLETGRRRADQIAREIRGTGLGIAALALFTEGFTDPESWAAELETATEFIRLAPAFHAHIVVLAPGGPASAEATDDHWRRLHRALDKLVPVASSCRVRLAVESGPGQLTDTLVGCQRLLEVVADDTVGLCVDVLDFARVGGDVAAAIPVLAPRLYHVRLSNGCLDETGNWQYQALDQGLLDYPKLLPILTRTGYRGYLSVACRGPAVQTHPVTTASYDLTVLRRLLPALTASSDDAPAPAAKATT